MMSADRSHQTAHWSADTAIGGLKATFLSSYIHTVYIYVVLCIFSVMVYATSPDLGSPSKVRRPTTRPSKHMRWRSSELAMNDINPLRGHCCSSTQDASACMVLQVWDNLNALAKVNPVSGNLDGEYLTMLSKVSKCTSRPVH
jgi:hypothetical protein